MTYKSTFIEGEVLAAVMASLGGSGAGAKILYADGRVRHVEWTGEIWDAMPDGTRVTIKAAKR